MSQFAPPSSRRPRRTVRLASVVSLLGAAVLAGPISAAAAPVHHHSMAHRDAAQARETVENRISTLHSELNITLDQEAKWAAVAQVMRDNEADMQRLVAERHAAGSQAPTAVEDLKTYERFNQAHVSGLKNLISSFETLYGAMPAPQQAVADHVFRDFGHHNRALKS